MDQKPRHTLLTDEILMHYLQNPNAVDSVEGIAEWRLLAEIVQRRVHEADAAVTWLVEQGFLERIEAGAIPSLYRLNEAKREEAERYLREHGRKKDEP